MGVVYLAEDPRRGKVALKFLNATGQEAASLSKRFQREATQLSQLTHPNIVGFFEAGYFQKQNYIAMEYVSGGSLRTFLQQQHGPLTLQQSLELFAGVADGLEYIHSQGLIHRDLKPDNILLTPDLTPKIGDFGLALKLEDQASRITKSGMILGTFSYLSPEQILSRDVGPSTDLYALGCCLYESITGRPIFSADTEFALLNSHLRETPVPPREIRVDIPPELDTLILRLIQKQASERPETAAEVARILRRIQQSLKQVWSLPVVGREHTLHELEQMLRPCLLRQSVAVMLTAPNGQGRSRVVRQLTQQLRKASIAVHPIVPLPYQKEPALDLYRQLGGQPEPWLQALRHAGPAGAARLLWQQLEQMGSPRILVIDDLLRQPATTSAIVEQLCLQPPPPGFGWLLSCATHRAQTLKRWDGAIQVELGPLDDQALRDVAQLQLSGHLDDELSEGLLFRAGGSVRRLRLWILALRGARLLRRNGQLVQRDLEQPWPENLWEPLWLQLSARPEVEVRILRIACLLDEPFPFELAQSMSEVDEAQAQCALDLLLRDGLLEECWGHTGELFQFSSRELKEKLAASTTDRLKRRLYSKVAQILENKAPVGVLAQYLQKGGQDAEALTKFLQAAMEAEQSGDSTQAERFWAQAWQLCGTQGPSEIRLMCIAGRCENLLRQGRLLEVEEAAKEELQLPIPENSDLKRSRRNLAGLVARARWLCGHRGEALRDFCCDELGQLAHSDFSDSLWLTWCWAGVLLEDGKPAEGLEILQRLPVLETYPSPYFWLKAALLRSQGRADQADIVLREVLNSGHQRPPGDEVEILLELAQIQVQLGNPVDQQTRFLDQAALRAQEINDPNLLAEIEWHRGLLHEAQHDMGAAVRSFQRVIETSQPAGAWLAQGQLQLAVTFTKLDRFDEAQRVLGEALQRSQSELRGQLFLAQGAVHLVRAEWESARESFVEAEKQGAGASARIMRCWCLWSLDQKTVAKSLIESLEELEDPLEKWLRQRLMKLQFEAPEPWPSPEEGVWISLAHPLRGILTKLLPSRKAPTTVIKTIPPTPAKVVLDPKKTPTSKTHRPTPGTGLRLVFFLLILTGIGLIVWPHAKSLLTAEATPTASPVVEFSQTPTPSPTLSASPTPRPTFVPPSPGKLVLKVQPKDAEVRLNGRRYELVAGAIEQPLEPGSYHMEVRADGFESEERELAVGESEVIQHSLELKALPGELEVTTVPAPSRIFVNGLEVGRTDSNGKFVKDQLKPGSYIVKAVRDGYISEQRSIEIRGGEVGRRRFELKRVPPARPAYVPPPPGPAPPPRPIYYPPPRPAPAPAPRPGPGLANPDSF